ncbi:hypothetical protein CWE08_11280 [Aliidiomarina iranensis]|uniref:Uncharacterized protein n=1 Tax=Aliidiomarina iranensis TaxID=1434071 RepID=A0A432VQM9_9GAMM|nr:hypothetical protein CWE08_11280 [Aliidiomarina iranensis]
MVISPANLLLLRPLFQRLFLVFKNDFLSAERRSVGRPRLSAGLVIAAAFIVSGCSTPTLYLTTEGYSETQQADLRRQLEALDYAVETTRIEIPEAFPDTTISVNPAFSDIQFLERLAALLEDKTQAAVHSMRFGEGNHAYFGKNIGIYVRNPESKQQRFANPFLRSAQCPQQDGLLKISNDGSFQLEFVYYADDEQNLHYLNGLWRWHESTLSLVFSDGSEQHLQHRRSEVATYQGMCPTDIYTPIHDHSEAIVNCAYQVIHMR